MTKKKDPSRLWALTKIALNVTMGLLYIFIGFFIIRKQWFMTELDTRISYAMGILLIAYGLFRMYRILKK
jgi:uncharacterized membrane protein YczE